MGRPLEKDICFFLYQESKDEMKGRFEKSALYSVV